MILEYDVKWHNKPRKESGTMCCLDIFGLRPENKFSMSYTKRLIIATVEDLYLTFEYCPKCKIVVAMTCNTLDNESLRKEISKVIDKIKEKLIEEGELKNENAI